MIGSLRGTVLDRAIGGEVLVEVGGVGYRVAVPAGALAALEPGAPAFLFTHLVVREDALSLYGFPDREQRDTFEALMSATGVGPKLALAILSVHSPSGPAAGGGRGRPRRPHPRPRRRQAHGPAAHDRAGGQARRHRPRPRRRSGRRPAPGPRCGPPWRASATAPTRCAYVLDTPARRRAGRGAAEGGAQAAGRRAGGRRRRAAVPTGTASAVREELLRAGASPAEEAEETTLRPRRLAEFVGQPALRGAPRDRPRRRPPAGPGRRPPAYSPAPRAWGRPPWPGSWPPRWAWACGSPAGRRWSGRATWPPS